MTPFSRKIPDMLVIDAKDPAWKLGKFVYHDILLRFHFAKDEIDSQQDRAGITWREALGAEYFCLILTQS